MKNILLLKGDGVYGATRNYVDKFAKAFQELGYNTIIIDVMNTNYKEHFRWVLENYIIYASVDCNAMQFLLELTCNYDSETAVVTYFCDHPLYHVERLNMIDDNSVLLNVDRKNIAYLNQHYKRFQRTAFLPLAGEATDFPVPYDKRSIGVLFTGSYLVPVPPAQKPLKGDIAGQIRWEVQEQIQKFPHQTLEEVLEEILDRYGIAVSNEEFVHIMAEMEDIEQYIRFYYRDQIIRTLLKAGIRISVFGEGWEKLECEGKENLTVLRGGLDAARRVLGDTKIALNVMPWFKDGLQERVVSGMLSGALVVTDTSRYIKEEFCDGEDIIFYRLEDLNELPLKIKNILSDDEYGSRIANAGQKKAQEGHTWLHRVRKMADLIEKAHDKIFESCEKKGTELEINIEDECVSYSLQSIGVKLSDELNLFNELNENGYLRKEDVERIFKKIVDWDQILMQKCGYKLVCDENISFFYQNTMRVFENQNVSEYQTEISMITLLIDGILRKLREKLRAAETEELMTRSPEDWNHDLYDELLVKIMMNKYLSSSEPYVKDWVTSIKCTNTVQSYPQKLISPYIDMSADIQYDAENNMIYVMHHGRRMYYPAEYSPEQVYVAYRFTCIEQDRKSPHCYLDDTFFVEDGSVLIDAGVAEGNFALDVIDLAKKVYLVECDEKWIPALELTFAPYHDKVEIIPKALGNKNEGNTITIDRIADGEKIDFIKMDVEGAEADALEGAENTFAGNDEIKCVVAVYHKHGMEERVKRHLRERQFEVTNTNGFLFYKDYEVPVWENELRHALVRAEKRKR